MTQPYRGLTRLAASAVALLLIIAPAYASAATRSHYSSRSSSSQYQYRGHSSAIQKAIDKLDDDEVEDLPIPIVLGVSVANLWPNFGDPRDGGARTHEGLDIMAPRGSFIASPTDAVVTKIGTGDSAGNYVYTAAPGGETFAYMHLDQLPENIEVGDVLEPGDFIGFVGNTGDAAGGPTHLHFEVRDGRTPTDPLPRLTKEFTLEERITALTGALKELERELKEAD